LAPLTDGTASGLLATPNLSDIRGPSKHHPERSDGGQPNLAWQVRQQWPTPCAEDAKNVPYQKGKHGQRYPMLYGAVRPETIWPTPKSSPSGPDYARASREGSGGDDLATVIGGSLNPMWVSALMGYPPNWTEL